MAHEVSWSRYLENSYAARSRRRADVAANVAAATALFFVVNDALSDRF